jgi:hypothetical protein
MSDRIMSGRPTDAAKLSASRDDLLFGRADLLCGLMVSDMPAE